MARVGGGSGKWGAISVSQGGRVFSPLPVVHVLVQMSADTGADVRDDLSITLRCADRTEAGPIALSAERALTPAKGSLTTRHYLLNGDARGDPLDLLSKYGAELSTIVVERDAMRRGAPYLLESVTVWAQHTGRVAHFSCGEWIDDTDTAVAFGGAAGEVNPLRRELRASGARCAAPPPPPSSLKAEVRVSERDGKQTLTLSWERPDGASSSSTDRASGFRVQCARDDKTASAAAALGGSRRHAAAIDVDHTNTGGTRERPGVDLDLFPPHGGAFGGVRLHPGGTYLVRVASTHRAFGVGAYSPPLRVTLSLDAAADPPRFSVDTKEAGGRSRSVPRGVSQSIPSADVRHAVWLRQLSDEERRRQRERLLRRDRGETIESVDAADDRALAAADASESFDDALAPPPLSPRTAAGGKLACVGDAEVWAGALDLTPLRKGMGLSGAAWWTAPLAVANGFESEFTFRIVPPPPTQADEKRNLKEGNKRKEPPPGSDGFAFVLQLDGRKHTAIGSSGIQLGHGGLTTALAVQFCTNPSCATRVRVADGGGELGDDRMYLPTAEGGFSSRSSRVTLCTLPEPHDHIFYVPHAYAAKECVCPFTGLHFMAPSFDGAEEEEEAGWERVDLRHHVHRVSVQCAGMKELSSGPEASLASAPLPINRDGRGLDDGEEHRARIVLQRNVFEHRALPPTAAAAVDENGYPLAGAPASHRLLVYVDDMQTALINLEVELGELFCEEGKERTAEFRPAPDVAARGRMYAGFTSGTGRRYASHVVSEWSFHEVLGDGIGAADEGTSWLQRAKSLLG